MGYKYILHFFLLCILPGVVYTQSVAPVKGFISGYVKDSATGQPLPMATVSSYKSKDSVFIVALFSGNNGSFLLRPLPVDTTITVTISYVGYKRYVKRIQLSPENSGLKLGDILLSNDARALDVVVTAELPPVRMKGDTLEINPAAFNAGPNAVVEDMLKKVPGVVVWGDNKITVNGKVVKELLVDGKPFLTGTISVATQNLPPEIIKKIQVYTPLKERPDEKTMNLILKDDKKKGRFGTLSAAAGTQQRHEYNATWIMYKPKQQFTAGFASNNINKTATDLGSILQNSTFRGNISNPSYQSNFSIDGTNNNHAGGLLYKKEITEKRNLEIEYTGSRNTQTIQRTQTDFTYVNDSSFNNLATSGYATTNWNHNVRGSYAWIQNEKRDLQSGITLSINKTNSTDSSITHMNSSSGLLLNRSDILQASRQNQHNLEIKTTLDNHPFYPTKAKLILNHTLNIGNYSNNRKMVNNYEFHNSNGSTGREQFNRLFDEGEHTIANRINASYNVNYLFSRLRNHLIDKKLYLNIDLFNNVGHSYTTSNAVVNDYDSTTATYQLLNGYLTNTNRQTWFEEKPGISFSLNRYRYFQSRYNKELNFSLQLAGQYQTLNNQSDKAFRNIHNKYTALLPSAYFEYKHDKHQAFSEKLSLRYTTKTRIPELNELAPLKDSTNLLNITVGNPNLKMQYQHDAELSYQFNNSQKNQVITTTLHAATFSNRIIRNSFFDTDGKQTAGFINTSNYKNADFTTYYQQQIKLNAFTFNISGSGQVYFETGDIYVNAQKNLFQNRSYAINGTAYIIRDKTELSTSQNFRWSFNRLQLSETQTNTSFNYVMSTMLQHKSGKRLTVASNLNLVYYYTPQVPSLSRWIWNATFSYRMLKSEQLELRLSLNDILKQNQSIANTVYQNKITQTEVNRLTQFMLLGLSYYPRKFGSSKPK